MTAKASVLFVGLLLSALVPTAGSAASGDPTITSQIPVRPERLVCRREPVTGSHFKRRVCRTESQIRQDRAEAREELERMQAFRDAEIRMEAINRGR